MAPKKNKRNSPDAEPKLPFLEAVETQPRQYLVQAKDGGGNTIKITGPQGKKLFAQIATKTNPLRMEKEISKPMNGKKGSFGLILEIEENSDQYKAIKILDEEFVEEMAKRSLDSGEFHSPMKKVEQPDGSTKYELTFKFMPQWFKPREVSTDAHGKIFELKEHATAKWLYDSQFEVFGTATIAYGYNFTTPQGEDKYGYCLGPKDFFFQKMLSSDGEVVEPESKRAKVSDML